MPNNAILYVVLGIALFLIPIVLRIVFYKKPGQAGEENTLRIIKNFLKSNGYKKADYLLINNLIISKENYWSCEIDILLLTKKWIYVIEVKDWGRGRLNGNLNHEYLEWSYKVGKQRRYQRHRMYSPFWQNEIHIKRFKSYFQANEKNILGIIVFNSPYLEIALKENKKSIFENKHVWTRNVTRWLEHCESQNTQLSSFEELKKKVSKEITTPAKIRQHRAWAKEVRKGKEIRDILR